MSHHDDDLPIAPLLESPAIELPKILAGDLSLAERAEIEEVIVTGEQAVPALLKAEGEPEALKEDLRTQIANATLPGKVKLALFGNSTCRGILIRDPNKLVQLMVLKNPKLGENEIEDFAKNANLSGAVLRFIGESRQWVKSYSVKKNLVTNPKVPLDIALRWLKFLQAPDIKNIARSKNLPQVVVTAAKKRMEDFDKR